MEFYSNLTPVLEEIVSRWNVPGLAVGIVEHGEIIYARGFGVQSLETKTPVTTDSIFCVASIAKCFVASAVMRLVEQGKLELDTPVVQYLPYFKLDDDRCRQITLRMILSHTSGMPDMDEIEYDTLVRHPEYDEGAAERYVRQLSSRKMIAAPSERFAYSNIGYNVLGHLIAKITGQTFEEYMKGQILEPAGMPDSTFYPPDLSPERIAVPHLRAPQLIVNPVYPYHRADAPASFLHTSVIEMCHWAITSLHRGRFRDQRILTPDSYTLMWTAVARRGVPPWREEMGLGWSLGSFEGLKTVSHGGGGFGWSCMLVLLPEIDKAVIVLSNEESSAHERVLEAAIHSITGKAPQAGSVSWMIPIAQALRTGGLESALARYDEIKGNPDYYFEDYELIPLYYQLTSAKKTDLAMEVLELNLRVFPDQRWMYLFLANVCLQSKDHTHAEAVLKKASLNFPGDEAVTNMLKKIDEEKMFR